ncbi:MAG: polysaccharide biosynthesis tyrosine autokinase [Planctomycetota bacterium]
MSDSKDLADRLKRSPQRAAPQQEGDTLDVVQAFFRQRWLVAFVTLCGLGAGIAYALTAEVWYQSNAKVLIAEKSAGLGSGTTGTSMVEEDVLANHIELLQSRRIVGDALRKEELLGMESIQPPEESDMDAIDVVVESMEIVKGGDGSAKSARSLSIALTHTDPEESRILLSAVMKRYEQFIIDQVEQVMGRANEMIQEAKEEVEGELLAAEDEHLRSRKEAPLFFQGEGSSNVYQDRYRRLQDELLDLDIQESTLKTRLDRVQSTLAEMDASESAFDHLDKLALIDSQSLERLGLFAGIQINASNTPEFKAAMPAKMEEARTQITHLLRLNSEKQRLSAAFGAGYPKVQEIESEIQLVKKFLEENQDLTESSSTFGDAPLTPESLLKAYIGFLQHDASTLAERRKELILLAADAESKAKELIEYELKDLVLQKKIERQEALFDGIVQQLRDLDTASSLSGYLYEFLEVPRAGAKVWPSLPLCGLAGLMLGLVGGVTLAVAAEVRDGRFRSASELDEVIGLRSLGHVGRLPSISRGIKGLIAAETSPDAEAFRLGRTLLLPDIQSGDLRTIGFTSPMQGDGKSTIVANFAVSFAQIGLKVLVVDGDLRRPSAHRYFSIPIADGLRDVLEGNLDLDSGVKATELDNVSVLTAGAETKDASEKLQSPKFDELLAELKKSFDVILVDLPPVLAVSDPVVALPRLDGGIMVVRVAQARRDEVVNTMRRVSASGGNLVGCMLNVFGAGKKFDGSGGYYGYYQSDYTRSSKRNGQPATRAATPVGIRSESRND